MGEVFADRVQVTFDRADWRSVRSGLLEVVESVGAATEFDTPSQESALWTTSEGGTLNVKRYGPVVAVGASGRFLATLRAAGMFMDYLARLGSVPHKVTHLDATMDVLQDPPPVLESLFKRATSVPGIALSRKAVPVGHVTRLQSVRPDGRASGTVYVGGRHADVRLCAYDKSLERESKGQDMGPPTVRWELRLKGGNVTLRDVAVPAPVFWHYMARVLPRPEGVPAWEPANDAWSPERTLVAPADRLRRRVELSRDLAAMVRLAREECGGLDALLQEIRWAYPDARAVVAA